MSRRASTPPPGRRSPSARRRIARSHLSELVDTPILIVHVSGQEAIEQIRWARSRGLRIYAETCPQYLFLTADDLGCARLPRRQMRLQPAAARSREPGRSLGRPAGRPVPGLLVRPCAVPLRRSERQEGRQGGVELRLHPERHSGPRDAPAAAVLRRRRRRAHRLCQFVALTATNAAKMYGLYPRKGSIAIGADADLAIWDADREVTIANDLLHHNVDYTPYEGMRVRGWPVTTISRGEIVWTGRCVPRGRRPRPVPALRSSSIRSSA